MACKLSAKSANFILLDPIGRAKDAYELRLDRVDIAKISKKINYCKDIYTNINIGYLDPANPRLNLPRSREAFTKISCSAGTTRLAIRSDGSVFPCVYAFHDDKFKMGSIISEIISDIWQNPIWKIFRGDIELQDLPRCRSCEMSENCDLIFCRLRAYYSTGDFFGSPYNCKSIKYD